MKTCKYCGNQYDNTWRYWSSKYCCKECYNTLKSKYTVGTEIYTYINHKQGKSGYVTAEVGFGIIVNIYKLQRASSNGIYQYAIKLQDEHICYRFVHQIFDNESDCKQFVDITNKRREIMREARNLINE
jgi:hypothetical protein